MGESDRLMGMITGRDIIVRAVAKHGDQESGSAYVEAGRPALQTYAQNLTPRLNGPGVNPVPPYGGEYRSLVGVLSGGWVAEGPGWPAQTSHP